MTVVSSHKKIEIGKETYFVERYWEKGFLVELWRYGYYCKGQAILLKDHLLSRPNIKKLFAS